MFRESHQKFFVDLSKSVGDAEQSLLAQNRIPEALSSFRTTSLCFRHSRLFHWEIPLRLQAKSGKDLEVMLYSSYQIILAKYGSHMR